MLLCNSAVRTSDMSQQSAGSRLLDQYVPLRALNLETLNFNQDIYDCYGMLALCLMDVSMGEEQVCGQICHTSMGWCGSHVISRLFNLRNYDGIQQLEKNQAKIKAFTTKLKC